MRSEILVIGQRQEVVDGEGGGSFKGRSSTLEQTESLFAEGRADDTIGPEELGVELFRQLGLKEDGGLSAQGRHFAKAGKSV